MAQEQMCKFVHHIAGVAPAAMTRIDDYGLAPGCGNGDRRPGIWIPVDQLIKVILSKAEAGHLPHGYIQICGELIWRQRSNCSQTNLRT